MATIPSGTKFLGVDPAFTDLTERKGSKIDRKSEYFTIADIAEEIGPGPTGPQGVQGPAGPQGALGPVGPAGLEWRGAWVSGTSYVADDAVGYGGASYFCISATSGTTTPNLDTTKWALLAAQGAQGQTGATGAQGPQGPRGPRGETGPAGTPVGTNGIVEALVTFPYPVLEYSISGVYSSSSDTIYRVVLPTSTATIGQKVIVSCIGSHRVSIKAVQFGGGGIYINSLNSATVGEFYIYPNQTYEFTYYGDGEWLSYFEEPKVQYKSYVAQIIPDSSSAITTNVLENTLGTTVALSWVSGKLRVTLGSSIMTTTNFYLNTSSYFGGSNYYITTPTPVSLSAIDIDSYKVNGTPAQGWAFGSRIYFEIRIYS